MAIKLTDGNDISGHYNEYLSWPKRFRSVLRYRNGIDMELDRLLGQANQSPSQYFRRQVLARNLLESKSARESSRFGRGHYIGIQDQEAEWEKQKAELRKYQRALFDAMMASPISLNRTSATHDDILRGREEQSRTDAERLREYFKSEEAKHSAYGPEVPRDWDIRDAKRRQRQASDYEHDVLPDFAQKLKDLTEKYGSESKAFDVMYKNNPLLKQIAKEMPGLTKAFMKSLPYLKIGGVATAGAFTLWRTILKEQRGFAAEGIRGGRMGIDSFTAISANTALKAAGGSEKSLSLIGTWDTNVGKMMRGGSSDFIAQLAKYGVNVFGTGKGGLATGEEIFTNVTKRIRELRDSGDNQLALALADTSGIDQAVWKKIPHVEGGDVLKWIKKEGKESGADRAAAEEDRTLRFHEAETKFLRGWMANILFPKKHQTAIDAYLDSISFGMHGALESILPEKFRIIRNISNESSSLPSQGMSAPESSASQSGSQVSINIGTVDVNADNPEQLAYELGAVASSHSKNHTLAVAFDSGLKA